MFLPISVLILGINFTIFSTIRLLPASSVAVERSKELSAELQILKWIFQDLKGMTSL